MLLGMLYNGSVTRTGTCVALIEGGKTAPSEMTFSSFESYNMAPLGIQPSHQEIRCSSRVYKYRLTPLLLPVLQDIT